jgi:hypothetical protein
MRPLCFVLMPFGVKPSGEGGTIDFDAVYKEVIAPAIEAAGLEPLRADEEMSGGIIHKPMYERLILCEYAVADLTTANANVFYELGLRHAVRKHSTVMLFAAGSRLPFDVNGLRCLPYKLAPTGEPTDCQATVASLSQRLNAAQQDTGADSPLYQLLQDYPNVQHEKTDVFRERVAYSAAAKQRLALARKKGLDAVLAEEAALGEIAHVESGVLVDLFLSYRAVKGWQEMIALAAAMPKPLAETVLVREQLGLALNRAQQGEEAEQVLLELIAQRGPSSETYGILGRVYKDRWDLTRGTADPFTTAGLLDKAIDAYLKGFEADWRDAYPGINAITLMEMKTLPDPRGQQLVPIVRYAVERRMAQRQPDYWDLATVLELAVLGADEAAARATAGKALAQVREKWEPETTARNLGLIRVARAARGQVFAWADEIEVALVERSKR